ncbi:MAG: superoxide dismutase [Gammaproteobacteria bacterium]|nr:superoxide dismutase [Gammaproteobacteria bacterium]
MFTLSPLPYAHDVLEPVLSRETLEYHYDKHHKGYVTKLNELAAGKGVTATTLEELVMNASGAIYDNAAQIWNHDFYWAGLCAPADKQPTGALAAALSAKYGSFEGFKDTFEAASMALFGSGWSWLVVDAGGRLEMFCGSNADNPLKHGSTPLLGCDVWEHAYYIDYRNLRTDYLKAFWTIVDWDRVAERYGKVVKK